MFPLRRIFIKKNLIIRPLSNKRQTATNIQEIEVKSVFHNVSSYKNKTAIIDNTGNYTFGSIFAEADSLSKKIVIQLNGKTGERVLFLCPNDASYVVTIWAIWLAGQIAVPLSPLHPESLLEYYVEDTKSQLLLSSLQFENQMGELSKKLNKSLMVLDNNLLKLDSSKRVIDDSSQDSLLPYVKSEAMILYTSGTTGKPKGVVLTHKNIFTQMKILTESWKWSDKDVILHTLPLHHVHGTINALFCPLFMGATTIMLPKFNAKEVWSYLLNRQNKNNDKVSVFMAVPTIYSKLVEEFNNNLHKEAEDIRQYLVNNFRLMVSGSAPLPEPLFNRWYEITGHQLLERYGMTEIGMCLSNAYKAEREPGYVGLPLPTVSVALADQETGKILLKYDENTANSNLEDVSGELLVKGDSVFKEYFNKPKETAKEFNQDGWFKTGDMAQYVKNKNKIKMLGRKSVDIIKSGGYKISALQIETLLLAHPDIKECAVLGVPDVTYGEKVAAVLVLEEGHKIDFEDLREWAKEKMPKYWIPSILKIVKEIPKNAMGKINKKALLKELF
ncbi:malonate--CoA ligase ACSF3, mitochondrial-like [Anthonomus grandis grandis]|uniref:malonate--CoA ligase ACSF3, mitochondrial-like n=1 Tax=Anthonomus grandis grandis TaxID=2921223 RepID=UPI002164F788|nr:malonate--CoA ligase ACSF3, mitochondrial-like [Anthonomus grandis grandis]